MKKPLTDIKSHVRKLQRMAGKNGGFGLNEFLGIAAALIIAAFVIIPGLTDFAKDVMEQFGKWWNNISEEIFKTKATL